MVFGLKALHCWVSPAFGNQGYQGQSKPIKANGFAPSFACAREPCDDFATGQGVGAKSRASGQARGPSAKK
jgi:hypothetical protein